MMFGAMSAGQVSEDQMTSGQAFKLLPGLRLLKAGLVAVGVGIILLALATHLWQLKLAAVFAWLDLVFGPLFMLVFMLLTLLTGIAISQLGHPRRAHVWYEVGVQATGGIATLSLTFTLLGISLGVESLSQQVITPDSIGAIIQGVTKHFSTAFLTTVVGLPTAHVLRSILAVRWVARTNPTSLSEVGSRS